MTIPEDSTIDIEESVERSQARCRGNSLHNGPLFWCMWRYVSGYTRRKITDREATKPHYGQAEGTLCEKCIAEFGALRVPNKRF